MSKGEEEEMATATAKKGRPPGAKNIERPTVIVRQPKCPNASCHSTRRVGKRKYAESRVKVERDGVHYNRQVRYRTQCADCGQHYSIAFLENEPETPAPERDTLVEYLEVHPTYFKQAEQQSYFADGPHGKKIGGEQWRYGRLRDGRIVKAKG